MRIIIFFTIFILVCNCEKSTDINNEYTYSWPLNADSMHFAILILDYESYNVEGGYFTNHEKCTNKNSSLPFDIIVREPMDFGSITFLYNQTKDTLFAATIVWRGKGSVTYPHNILYPDTFKITTNTTSKPDSLEYFKYFIDYFDDNLLKLKSDTVWSVIEQLDIVNDFSQQEFKSGIFLYPPTVGGFSPESAKWIVFLCS